ncbi:MAG: hypothetical protein ACRCW2_12525, partial [Cellulosilyticaceae bacterium]
VEKRLTKDWIAYRLSIFMKYTYSSLVRQYNQAFKAFIQYDPVSERFLREELEKYPKLNDNIIFTPDFDQSVTQYIKDDSYFAMVYLDSDNMLSPNFVERILKEPTPGIEVIISSKGYAYEVATQRIGLYAYSVPDTFYVLIYPTTQYLAGFRYQYPCNQYGDVTFGPELLKLKYKRFEEQMFMIIIHQQNVSHNLEYMRSIFTIQGFVTNPYEKSSILSEYDIG